MPQEPFDAMKYIWEQVSKISPDGRRFIKYDGVPDLEYLYETGFVDTDEYTLSDWVEAFKDSRQPDGSYLLTEAQWMAKRKYRYEGPIAPPFDPYTLREGPWEIHELDRLLEEKFFPQTKLTREQFKDLLKKAKETGGVVDGKYQMNRTFMLGLREILDRCPSPRRSREVSFSEAMKKQPPPLSPSGKVASQQPAQPQSAYATGPSKERTMADQLAKLLSRK